MPKSLDISRLFGQSSFIFLKNISGLIYNLMKARKHRIPVPHGRRENANFCISIHSYTPRILHEKGVAVKTATPIFSYSDLIASIKCRSCACVLTFISAVPP